MRLGLGLETSGLRHNVFLKNEKLLTLGTIIFSCPKQAKTGGKTSCIARNGLHAELNNRINIHRNTVHQNDSVRCYGNFEIQSLVL